MEPTRRGKWICACGWASRRRDPVAPAAGTLEERATAALRDAGTLTLAQVDCYARSAPVAALKYAAALLTPERRAWCAQAAPTESASSLSGCPGGGIVGPAGGRGESDGTLSLDHQGLQRGA